MARRRMVKANFRISEDDLNQVAQIATQAGKKPSALVRQIIADWLEWQNAARSRVA